MERYRKKPVVVEAIQFKGWNWKDCVQFMSTEQLIFTQDFSIHDKVEIKTDRGITYAEVGDYIVKSVNFDFFYCKPDVFEATHELVNVNETYIDRLKKEHKELTEKITKLEHFTKSKKFNNFPTMKKSLLLYQLDTMRQYSNILYTRLPIERIKEGE